jgi:Rps23 Pro-64 3,4-dihydroxylase Tpa1-like proline 4-hydroxylase
MSNIPDDVYINNIKKIGKDVKNIHVFENFLNDEDYKYLYQECLDSDWSKIDKPIYTSKGRRDKSIVSDKTKEIFENVQNILSNKIKEIYDVSVSVSSPPLLIKWDAGSEMNEHVDDFSVFHYQFAAILYLNDNYSGGEIRFPDYKLTIKPKENSLILFPSNKYYSHEVLINKSGERYTMPMWFKLNDSNFKGYGKALSFENIKNWQNDNWENKI